jgi:MFS family permease
VPALGLFTGVAALSGFLAFASLRSTELGLHLWSLALGVFGVVVVTCRVVFAKLPDRVPAMRLAAASLGATAAGLLITASVPAAWGLFLGATVLAVGTAFLTPAVFAAIFGSVPEAQRGSAAGTASVFIDLGFSGGPVVFGLVAAAGGIPRAFVAGAVLAAGGGTLLAFRQAPSAPLTGDSGTA